MTSRQEIITYLGISKHMYSKFVKMGLPVLYIDGRCYAHKSNLDEFFKSVTRVTAKNIPDHILNSDDSDQ